MTYDGDTVKDWAGSSQWRAWRADLARFQKHGYSGWFSEGLWALTVYRLQRGLAGRKPRMLYLPFRLALVATRKILTLITHINLHPNAKLGPGLLIPHVGPIQVFPWATIGADCAIHQVCTIGAGSKPGGPVIGDHVMIGCHTCILGPVTVGSRVQIGAGAVVVTDIPDDCTAIGIPAKPIRRRCETVDAPGTLGLNDTMVDELIRPALVEARPDLASDSGLRNRDNIRD